MIDFSADGHSLPIGVGLSLEGLANYLTGDAMMDWLVQVRQSVAPKVTTQAFVSLRVSEADYNMRCWIDVSGLPGFREIDRLPDGIYLGDVRSFHDCIEAWKVYKARLAVSPTDNIGALVRALSRPSILTWARDPRVHPGFYGRIAGQRGRSARFYGSFLPEFSAAP